MKDQAAYFRVPGRVPGPAGSSTLLSVSCLAAAVRPLVVARRARLKGAGLTVTGCRTLEAAEGMTVGSAGRGGGRSREATVAAEVARLAAALDSALGAAGSAAFLAVATFLAATLVAAAVFAAAFFAAAFLATVFAAVLVAALVAALVGAFVVAFAAVFAAVFRTALVAVVLLLAVTFFVAGVLAAAAVFLVAAFFVAVDVFAVAVFLAVLLRLADFLVAADLDTAFPAGGLAVVTLAEATLVAVAFFWLLVLAEAFLAAEAFEADLAAPLSVSFRRFSIFPPYFAAAARAGNSLGAMAPQGRVGFRLSAAESPTECRSRRPDCKGGRIRIFTISALGPDATVPAPVS